MSAVSKAFGNRTSPPSVVPSSVHYLTKQPGLLLLLLLFTSCSLSLSLSFFRFLPSQCSSVCHGGCLNKQTHEGPRRSRRRDVRLFALVAPVREKVFLRGTQRSGAQQRDHKTNIYPPASRPKALSSLHRTGNKRMDPLLVLKWGRDVVMIQRGLTLNELAAIGFLHCTINAELNMEW